MAVEPKSFDEYKALFVYKRPKTVEEIMAEQTEISKQFSNGYKEIDYGNI